MADAVDVRIRGLAELAAGTRKLADNIGHASETAFAGVADAAASKVRASVPHRTGRLAASVDGRPVQGGASVEMGEGVRYAQYVEYGGRGFPRSATGNYLYPVAMGEERELVAAATKAANAEIGAMSWPSPS